MALRPLDHGIGLMMALLLHAPARVAARADVPAQFYKLYQQQSTLPSVAFLPDPMPDAVTKRLKDLAFSDLSVPLQHALLWDAGLVASGDTSRSAYVQVKVPCGSTMSDIFLARDTVSEKAKCGLVVCNAQILHFAYSNCSLAHVAEQTKCGIADGAPVSAVSSNPVWMEDGEIDSTPGFQVFLKHSNASSASAVDGSASATSDAATTLYTIQEKPGLKLYDDMKSCPNKASFIIPCRQLSSSDIQSPTWCDPAPGVLVDLWINQEAIQRQNASGKDSSATMVTVFVVLFVTACVLCAALAVCLWKRGQRNKKPRAIGGRSGDGDSGGGASALLDHDHDHHHVMAGRHEVTTDSENTPSLNHDRPTFTTLELEKINANFCARSRDLADFCDDQELMMKRISYASLQFSTLIARGANGEVWRGEYAGQDVAIKRMMRDKHGEIIYMEVFAREIRLASTLEHPNIVKFIGLSWRSLTELCMVSEFMPMGDLAHYLLSKESRNLSWANEKMALALDIANALVYLHSLMPVIIHRDLKSLNVLLNENLEAKLSDFGLSRERSFEETMTSGVGTMIWTAPEVLRGDRYTEKADIYSYGVVLSELDTCLPPYSLNEEVARAKQKSAQLLPMIRNGRIKPQFRASVPKALHELALSCLDYVPEKRPNAMQIVYTLRSKVMPTIR